MDPNSSVGRIFLEEDNRESLNDRMESHGDWETPELQDTADNRESLNDRMESHGDWETPELQDTACSQEKKETKAFTFYRMETEEMSERYIAPCFKNGLEAYNGEINLEQDKNLISNEFAIKLCLEHEVKNEDKAIAIDIYKRFSILEEARPVIETMAYSDKYKKILDSISLDKQKLDCEIKQEEEEAVKKVMGEALKENKNPEEARPVIETMAYSDKYKKILDSISLDKQKLDCEIKQEEEEAVKKVGVTTIIVIFLILDMLVDKEVLILVGRGFLATCGSILNTIDRVTSTFDRIRHQTFRAAQTSINTKSDSDDEEEYIIKRNSFRAPIFGPNASKYLNCNDPMDRALALQKVLTPFRRICVLKKAAG
nr:hypothetical protein [Tanacetum cinerariifolium]